MPQDRSTESVSDDDIKKLKEKHPGELLEVASIEGPAVFRKPTRVEYRFYQGMLFDEKKRPAAGDYLISACCVWPEKALFDAACERSPGISSKFANELLEFAGIEKDAPVKKH